MPVGIAAVVIFVLYMIDKHERWRFVFKLALWIGVLGVVGLGGWFGWSEWQDYREARAAKQAAAFSLPPDASALSADPYASIATPAPVWVYVDVFEEFSGHFSTQPKAPSQITEMLRKNEACQPGSITWGADKTEWICVQPETLDIPNGSISLRARPDSLDKSLVKSSVTLIVRNCEQLGLAAQKQCITDGLKGAGLL